MWASARLFLLAAVVSGCASVAPMEVAVRRSPPPDLLRFGVDTFAFANESRSKNSGKPDLYANYCFVMARAVTQFQRFARFDEAAPRVAREGHRLGPQALQVGHDVVDVAVSQVPGTGHLGAGNA